MSVVHGRRQGPHPRAYRHKAAPHEAPYRPGSSALAGPTTATAVAAQLAADPEFQEWRAEERAAELGMLTRRALR